MKGVADGIAVITKNGVTNLVQFVGPRLSSVQDLVCRAVCGCSHVMSHSQQTLIEICIGKAIDVAREL